MIDFFACSFHLLLLLLFLRKEKRREETRRSLLICFPSLTFSTPDIRHQTFTSTSHFLFAFFFYSDIDFDSGSDFGSGFGSSSGFDCEMRKLLLRRAEFEFTIVPDTPLHIYKERTGRRKKEVHVYSCMYAQCSMYSIDSTGT